MVATTSTAGKHFQLLHNNDKMCGKLLTAIRKDDSDGVDDALDLKDLIVDDLNLTDDEMKAFMKGFLSTGELDVTLWEGYYESKALSNGDVYAMFIVSMDNKVYFGLKKNLLAKFTDYSMTYTTVTDGNLKFTASGKAVSILFTRDYDFEKGTLGTGTFTVSGPG